VIAIRADIAELLRAGGSDRRIAQQLHVDYRTVAAARRALGLPKTKNGPKPAATVEELWRARTRPVDGGHLLWTGHVTNTGTPAVRHGGRLLSAYRIAWRLRTGREPDGYVAPSCGMPLCVAPEHVETAAERRRNEAAFEAIFGTAS